MLIQCLDILIDKDYIMSIMGSWKIYYLIDEYWEYHRYVKSVMFYKELC